MREVEIVIHLLIRLQHQCPYLISDPVPRAPATVIVNEPCFALNAVLFLESDNLPSTEPRFCCRLRIRHAVVGKRSDNPDTIKFFS